MIEYRNAAPNDVGTYDCDINHPVYGWVPFTASPDDPEEHGRLIYEAIRDAIGE